MLQQRLSLGFWPHVTVLNTRGNVNPYSILGSQNKLSNQIVNRYNVFGING